jgi:hypothetical protein
MYDHLQLHPQNRVYFLIRFSASTVKSIKLVEGELCRGLIVSWYIIAFTSILRIGFSIHFSVDIAHIMVKLSSCRR